MNRKDEEGNNLFQGGFLGLDNISVIDRSMTLPEGVTLEQSDGTAWMASYCLNMAWAALELSLGDPAYEDLGTKFLEHYLAIGGAMNGLGAEGSSLWDEEDGFITTTCDRRTVAWTPLKVRSLVGLLPIVPAIALDPSEQKHCASERRGLCSICCGMPTDIPSWRLGSDAPSTRWRHMGVLLSCRRSGSVVSSPDMFDPNEFLSDFESGR